MVSLRTYTVPGATSRLPLNLGFLSGRPRDRHSALVLHDSDLHRNDPLEFTGRAEEMESTDNNVKMEKNRMV